MKHATSRVNHQQNYTYRKPLIYAVLIGGGAVLGGIISYEASHEIFKSTPSLQELQQSLPGILKVVDALHQSAQDTYSTLAGLLVGGATVGVSTRKLIK